MKYVPHTCRSYAARCVSFQVFDYLFSYKKHYEDERSRSCQEDTFAYPNDVRKLVTRINCGYFKIDDLNTFNVDCFTYLKNIPMLKTHYTVATLVRIQI